MQSYTFTADLLPNAVNKPAICRELFLFAAFCFCVVVHVAKQVSLFLPHCMEGFKAR